jgi:hypothetical protein
MPTSNPWLENFIKDWPEDEKEKAREGWYSFKRGFHQTQMGTMRQEFVETVLNNLQPSSRAHLKALTDKIEQSKNSHRFHQTVLFSLVATFMSGIHYAEKASKNGEDLSKLQYIFQINSSEAPSKYDEKLKSKTKPIKSRKR